MIAELYRSCDPIACVIDQCGVNKIISYYTGSRYIDAHPLTRSLAHSQLTEREETYDLGILYVRYASEELSQCDGIPAHRAASLKQNLLEIVCSVLLMLALINQIY